MNIALRQRIASDITSQLPPGTFNLNIDQYATLINCHPAHIRNQLSKGVFPIPTICLGRRRLIPLTAAIDYLTDLTVGSQQHPPKKPMGRPTKAVQRVDKAEAERLGLSVAEYRAQQKIAGV